MPGAEAFLWPESLNNSFNKSTSLKRTITQSGLPLKLVSSLRIDFRCSWGHYYRRLEKMLSSLNDSLLFLRVSSPLATEAITFQQGEKTGERKDHGAWERKNIVHRKKDCRFILLYGRGCKFLKPDNNTYTHARTWEGLHPLGGWFAHQIMSITWTRYKPL